MSAPVAVSVPAATRWSLATRIAFRFSVTYFTLYVLFGQMLGSMTLASWTPALRTSWPMRDLVLATARRVFHVDQELVIFSGSGDKIYDWVQAAILLTAAATITLLWSVLDRRRPAYAGLHKWSYVFVRFALGATMTLYGSIKLVPLQMPFPPLLRLIEPYGNFSPMGVLWYSIGASPAYEMFTGGVELLAAILLFIPATSLAGVLIALAATTQVFVLNMTYDVPVKLFSFHLILMSLFLLAPEARRLLNVIVLNRPAPPSSRPPLARRVWIRRTLVGLQLVWGAYLVGFGLQRSITQWYAGAGAPQPPFYGIWTVEEMTVDGQRLPPLLTDPVRWRRVIVNSGSTMALQRMDESLTLQIAKVDPAKRTIAMTPAPPLAPGMPPAAFPRSADSGTFTFTEPETDVLMLDGELAGRKVQARLKRYDLNQYLLMTRGFHWVQEYPFNR
ncbi:MAG TPA: hypothetical protein VFO19_19335 [Vicinamibacterales bacterium]|nr:hypothetical protein [Vicinamibacterales bacterium]